MKRKRFTAALLTLIAAVGLVTGGCSVSINFDPESSQTEQSSKSAQSSKKEASSKAASEASKSESKASKTDSGESSAAKGKAGSYTMADIKKLKNTQNFAKNTLEHIFDGTINSKGKATGYHYTLVTDSKGEVISGTRSKEDENGVFTGNVKVNGVKKNGFSSFYPESWTPQQVVDAINEAYEYALNDASNPHGSLWIGYSGDLEIDMYLNDSKKITTAYPIYEGD